MSHYTWLDANLNEFWVKVFGKDLESTGCAGIISAHGDKCYQYRDVWSTAGIPFYHGVAIYLLTYTNELGDFPKSQSCIWVINNYEKYKPLLNAI